MKIAIQFGAGNIGRGFIGALLSRSGYDVVFADISKTLIPELNSRGKYTVEVVGDDKREEEVSPVRGLFSDDPKLVDTIAQAEVITTAVGPNVLKFIAPVIAAGIEQRMKDGNESPLNIIACENMIGGSTQLKTEVLTKLSAEGQAFLSDHVGFPDSAVDRIVPPMEDTGDVLRVRVEEFSEWIVNEKGFCGKIPAIEGMQLTDNLLSFLERKLFTLNTGHSITAYLGTLRGYITIDESIANPKILSVVRGAMTESGEVLIRRYGFDRAAHTAYIEKILDRFRNPWLNDDVQRVGRQPMRKLGYDDRLIKPLRGTIEYGTSHRNLMVGIAAALNFKNSEDEQANKLQELLSTRDMKWAIKEITSLEDIEVIRIIEEAYSILSVYENLDSDSLSA